MELEIDKDKWVRYNGGFVSIAGSMMYTYDGGYRIDYDSYTDYNWFVKIKCHNCGKKTKEFRGEKFKLGNRDNEMGCTLRFNSGVDAIKEAKSNGWIITEHRSKLTGYNRFILEAYLFCPKCKIDVLTGQYQKSV